MSAAWAREIEALRASVEMEADVMSREELLWQLRHPPHAMVKTLEEMQADAQAERGWLVEHL
jgi:hypothetical protein